MNELSKNEMKKIIGGVFSPPDSICSVMCGDGTIGTHDCGIGVNCLAYPEDSSVHCFGEEYPHCPCDGHDIPPQ